MVVHISLLAAHLLVYCANAATSRGYARPPPFRGCVERRGLCTKTIDARERERARERDSEGERKRANEGERAHARVIEIERERERERETV